MSTWPTTVDGSFSTLEAGDVEVVRELIEQPCGVRDCAFREPTGHMIRIQEPRSRRLAGRRAAPGAPPIR